MTSLSGSTQRSRPVSTAAVVTHGRLDVDEAAGRVRDVAARTGVTLVDDPRAAEIVVALGGDGTMLRTLAQLLGSNVPVIGVNFGRVGFLASIRPDDLERNLERVFTGDYVVLELSTLEVRLDGARHVAVNDVVATSSTLGRMVELAWAVGGENLGTVPCDGMICSTPSGSTAYNLSNGGPVLVRGLDVTIRNATPDVSVSLLVDGHRVSEIASGREASVSLCQERSLLATLPETTFFSRYRETFSS